MRNSFVKFKGTVLLIVLLPAIAFAGNNLIELRNDSAGDEYFYCKARISPDNPQFDYYLQSKNPDVWTGTTGSYNSKIFPEAILWTIEAEYATNDGITPGTTFQLLINKNLPRGKSINYSACTRDTAGCQVSKEYGNHQQDWDAVLAKKNQVLTDAGLTDSSTDWDKVMALAKYILASPDGASYNTYFHPADFIKYSSWCTGRANTMVAFCSVMGIPARNIDDYTHSVCEVYLGGKWHYVENSKTIMNQIPNVGYNKDPLFDCSFLEMIADPLKYGITYWLSRNCGTVSYPNLYVHYNLEGYTNWIFNLEDTYPEVPQRIEEGMTICSAEEISALYPGSTSTYKCDSDVPSMHLTPYRIGWWQGYTTRKITQSNGIRQQFYLSSLSGITHLKATLLTSLTNEYTIPASGGDWYYLVNGNKYYLRDYGGWNLQPDYKGTSCWYTTFEIPLDKVVASPPEAPLISNFIVTSSSTDATLTWNTDNLSTSQVEYGTSTAYGSLSSLSSTLVTTHTINISGLVTGKEYYFRAKSKDSLDNEGISLYSKSNTAIAQVVVSTITLAGSGTAKIKVYPNPYSINSGKLLRFSVEGKPGAVVEIYTMSGVLVRKLSAINSGFIEWDGRNEDNEKLASGIYIYKVTGTDGSSSVGKLALKK